MPATAWSLFSTSLSQKIWRFDVAQQRQERPIPWKRRLSLVLKRSFDIVLACCLLPVLLAILPIVTVLIWFDSPGPIFFRQRRVGKNGKQFTIHKLRTMHAGSLRYDLSPQSDDHDSRVTWFGRILRKSGLDEIPQILNVLRGEMSFVGPRPEMPFLVEWYDEKQRTRLDVVPGITCLWQISSARSEPIHDNLHYDYYYVRHHSFWLDLWIIGGTIRVMLEGLRLRRPAPQPAGTIATQERVATSTRVVPHMRPVKSRRRQEVNDPVAVLEDARSR